MFIYYNDFLETIVNYSFDKKIKLFVLLVFGCFICHISINCKIKLYEI